MEYFEYIKSLFTPAQQTALGIITIAVIAATQVFKHVWFAFFPERRKSLKAAKIWLFSFCSGFLFGVAGYWIGKPPQELWFWLFCGVSSGAIAIGIYKLLIEIIWPRIKGKSAASN